jgi:hypothetical protein
MRYARLLGVVLLVYVCLMVGQVALAGPRPSLQDNAAKTDFVTLCADGCPPGPRPTMY